MIYCKKYYERSTSLTIIIAIKISGFISSKYILLKHHFFNNNKNFKVEIKEPEGVENLKN